LIVVASPILDFLPVFRLIELGYSEKTGKGDVRSKYPLLGLKTAV
jgi:hypothetical protein